MKSNWPLLKSAELEERGALLIQDGNHGEYRPRPSEFVDQGTVFIRAADLQDGRIGFSRASRINDQALARIRKGIGKPGDAIVSHKGTVGRVALAPLGCEPFVCSPQTTFWRALDQDVLDRRFLLAFLQSPAFQNQLESLMHASDMAAYVSLTVQRSLQVLYPPIDEQRRIGGVLSALDIKAHLNQKIARRLLDLAALMVDSVTEKSIGTKSVYEFTRVVYGAAFKSSLFGDEGMPVVRIRDLATHEPGVQTTEQHPKSRVVKAGDIVVGMDGEFRAHVWHGSDALLNQRVCLFEPGPGVSKAFVWRTIQPPLYFIEATETGTTVIHLGKSDIDNFELPLLDEAQMKALVTTVDPLIDLSVQLERESARLQEIKLLLLPGLVTGEIRVTETYNPPADGADSL